MIESGRSFSGNERNCVFINTGRSIKSGGKFADISFSSGLDYEDDARSVVPVDWDHDGDVDMFISSFQGTGSVQIKMPLEQELKLKLMGKL